MSLAVRAVRSLALMLGSSLFFKGVGVVANIVIVNSVSADEYGEANAAWILMLTASLFSSIGIGQYVMVRSRDRPDLAFHATVYQFLLGIAAVGVVTLLRDPLGRWVGAPTLGRFLPGFVVAMLVERIYYVPERVLMRDLRFARAAMARAVAEVTYSVVALIACLLYTSPSPRD